MDPIKTKNESSNFHFKKKCDNFIDYLWSNGFPPIPPSNFNIKHRQTQFSDTQNYLSFVDFHKIIFPITTKITTQITKKKKNFCHLLVQPKIFDFDKKKMKKK